MKYLITIFLLYSLTINSQTSPSQPMNGPGGMGYMHGSVIQNNFTSLFTGDGYWLFEPDQPKPDSADVVIFNHGWGVYNPGPYGQWIEHLVRKGNIVIFPKYQQNDGTFFSTYTPNAATGIIDAFDELNANVNRVKPRMNHIAMIGHSFGGVITANLAIEYNSYGVPKPKCFMLCEPGPGTSSGHLPTYSDMDTDYKTLIIVGDDDIIVGNSFGKMIFDSTNIPTSQKNYIIQYADNPPTIEATHNEPLAANNNYDGGTIATVITAAYVASKEDAVDYYCYWKLADALLSCTFYGTDCEYGFGDTPEQRFMGNWSDGSPITELEVFPKVNGIKESVTSKNSFYPNPASSIIHFEKEVAEVSLFNLEGKVVFFTKKVQQINISNLARGVYVLKIENTFQKLTIQ
ncbi:MAG: T9SS type A sorting domain-containing protein [Flavobacteriales bacterium]|nr:T9SS type A sorting domain-containing protein [Flavobacteriales bacterium]